MSQQPPSGPPPGYNQGQGQPQQPMRMGSPVGNRMMYMGGSSHNQGNFMGPGGQGGRLPQQQQGGMMGPGNMGGPQGAGGMGGQGMMTAHQGPPGGMQQQRKPSPQPHYVQQQQGQPNQQSFNQGQPSPMASNSPSGNSPAQPNPNIMSQDGPKPSQQPVMGSRSNAPGQQLQPQQPPTSAPVQAGAQPQQAGAQGPKSDLNTAYVCRIGQETVQEIVGRTQEVFSYLKALQPPVGNAMQDRAIIEKQQRLQEVLKGITHLFKRLNFCWTKAQEHAGAIEYTNIESLIPLVGDRDIKLELEKKRGDSYKQALDENNELTQQLVVKNRHLKEIIDKMRSIIWEINTMLAMR